MQGRVSGCLIERSARRLVDHDALEVSTRCLGRALRVMGQGFVGFAQTTGIRIVKLREACQKVGLLSP